MQFLENNNYTYNCILSRFASRAQSYKRGVIEMRTRCSAGSPLWLPWCCLLVCSIIPSSASHNVSCCPEDAVWSHAASNCSDGTKIRLHCPYGIFLIDSEDENFTVVQDDDDATWLVLDVNDRIPAGR